MNNQRGKRVLITRFIIVLASICFVQNLVADEPVFSIDVTLDLGEDIGQSFGSVFEAQDVAGNGIIGAGFADVYNTQFRNDRHVLQFYVKPDKTARRKHTITRLPFPGLGTGAYLLDFDQSLYAWDDSEGLRVRKLNDDLKTWSIADDIVRGGVRRGDGLIRVGNGILSYSLDGVYFDDKQILAPAKSGYYYKFYYANGRLFFYHRTTENGEESTVIKCAPWKPGQEQVDIKQVETSKTNYPRSSSFVWAQLENQVITVCNYGGVHVFKDGKWEIILEGSDQTSFQIYSAVNYKDILYLAQYPTGHLFEYDGQTLSHKKDWPPKSPVVSPSAREAQTTTIYRGELLVCVWPWAEIWRLNGDDQVWQFLGRAFTHPEPHNKTVHPYEEFAEQHNLVLNSWGQRVTGMSAIGSDLFLSTSSKGLYVWKDEYMFLTQSQREEYGSVLKLNMDGNLAASINWTGKPLDLSFKLYKSRLEIWQDGALIGKTSHEVDLSVLSGLSQVHLGQGCFGKSSGEVTLSRN